MRKQESDRKQRFRNQYTPDILYIDSVEPFDELLDLSLGPEP